MPKRLVIFDVDGTLVDSQLFIIEAQRRAFAAHRMAPVSREQALSIVGLSLREAFVVLAGPDAPVDSLAEAYRAAWTDMRGDPAFTDPLYEGARETIEGLAMRDDIILGIATGKSRRGVAHLLEAQGWESIFATIQTADTNASKPAPAMILKALAETGTAAADAVMVGDTTFDMAMARSADVQAIGVAWGYHRVDALEAAGASRIVASFAALREVLTMQDADV